MFWGVTLESGKRYSQVVDTSFHITMAALEPPTKELPKSANNVSVLIEHGKVEFLLCTLQYDRVMQVPLDLMFVEGEEVSFFLNGEGTVHLTGYVLDDDTVGGDEPDLSEASSEEEVDEADESEDSDENENFAQKLAKLADKDESDDEWTPGGSPGKKRKKTYDEGMSPLAKEPKKKKQATASQKVEVVETKDILPETPVSLENKKDEESDDSDEQDEEELSLDSDEEMDDEEAEDEGDDDDSDDTSDEEGDNDSEGEVETSEEDESSDESPIKSAKKMKLQGKQELNTSVNASAKKNKNEVMNELLQKKKKLQGDLSPNKSTQKTKEGAVATDSAKKGNKKNSISQQLFVKGIKADGAQGEGDRSSPKKGNKAKNESPVKTDTPTAQQTPQDKKKSLKGQQSTQKDAQAQNTNSSKKNAKLQNGTPQPGTPKTGQPNTPNLNTSDNKSPSKTTKTTLPGGVTVEDYVIGKGPMAKKGRYVHVYYCGKLQNNKEFDSVTKGKPFAFRLGRGEVIKGWDLGIEGMRVGGKRRIVVPPALGYGKKSVGPIPSNSTLHFEVELKAVS